MSRFHIDPLYGIPDNVWAEKAKLALAAGYKVEEIIRSTIFGEMRVTTWMGPESEHWAGWMKQFEKFLDDENAGMRKIAECGKDYTDAKRKSALEEERHEAIYGRR